VSDKILWGKKACGALQACRLLGMLLQLAESPVQVTEAFEVAHSRLA